MCRANFKRGDDDHILVNYVGREWFREFVINNILRSVKVSWSGKFRKCRSLAPHGTLRSLVSNIRYFWFNGSISCGRLMPILISWADPWLDLRLWNYIALICGEISPHKGTSIR